MTYCGTCTNIQLSGYPKHEREGFYRCKVTGKFHTLTKQNECRHHLLTNDIESRRKLIRGQK